MKKSTILWLVFAVVVIILLSWNHIFPHPAPVVDSATLPGMQTGEAPWNAEIPNLLARLRALELPALAQEGNVLHIHQHLDLSINGAPVAVPAGIGINEAAGFISPIHVHDTTGIIHVESNVVRDFTLGQFFDIWGVRFSDTCIGGYCADATHTLKVYSNGAPVSGDPRALILAPHQEIMIVYGGASSTLPILSSFTFPPTY
ncbi:MAG: hypothetical protein V4480_03290 [Patescibacteria group bacterium]